MQDRRQHARFSLNRPLEGRLNVMEDVVVERYADNEIIVVASMPARPNEVMVVDRVVTGNPSRVDVRVADSGPTIIDGRLKHRIRLHINGEHVDDGPRILGGLVKSMPARLLEVSEGGCLLESAMPVENGLPGELEIAFEDGVRAEPLRICRCQMVPGAGPVFRIGALFGPHAGSNHSFRRRLFPTENRRQTSHVGTGV